MAFNDPTKPLATCSSETCSGCGVEDKIHCHFQPLDLFHFLLLCLPGFLLGGNAVRGLGGIWLILWIGIIILYFGFIEIRVMCSHCPHYAEEGRTLSCWANHGSPKLWKYNPGPMSITEKIIFLGGFGVVWGYPVAFFIISGSWYLLIIYLLSVAGFFMTLKLFFCTQCINLACPLNGVDPATRQEFFERNPAIKEAWEGSSKSVGTGS